MIKEIVKDPVFLSCVSQDATMEDQGIVTDLLDTIEANQERCVGMAANMIGSLKNIVVILHQSQWLVLINPKVLKTSGNTTMKEEGCLCHSGVKKTVRFDKIQVEYLDLHWKRKIQTFSGFSAQILQHELDHLKGTLI